MHFRKNTQGLHALRLICGTHNFLEDQIDLHSKYLIKELPFVD